MGVFSAVAVNQLPNQLQKRVLPTFSPWTHTSDDSYIYQLSLVLATATVSFYLFVSLLLSSLWTSCGLRCRPFYPPVRAFSFDREYVGFSIPTASRFSSNVANPRSRAWRESIRAPAKVPTNLCDTSMRSGGLELTQLMPSTSTHRQSTTGHQRTKKSSPAGSVHQLPVPTHPHPSTHPQNSIHPTHHSTHKILENHNKSI